MPKNKRVRRKKNQRKDRSGIGGFAVPVPLITIMAVVILFSITYLCIHARCQGLGSRIQKLEREFQQVHNRVLNEKTEWAAMTSPANVRAALNRHKIIMDYPKPVRVVHMQMPVGSLTDLEVGEMARIREARRNE